MVELLLAAIVVVGVNVAAALGGYYAALNHVDRLLDIEEGESDPPFPPGLEERTAEDSPSDLALSAEEIDQIDEWDE